MRLLWIRLGEKKVFDVYLEDYTFELFIKIYILRASFKKVIFNNNKNHFLINL